MGAWYEMNLSVHKWISRHFQSNCDIKKSKKISFYSKPKTKLKIPRNFHTVYRKKQPIGSRSPVNSEKLSIISIILGIITFILVISLGNCRLTRRIPRAELTPCHAGILLVLLIFVRFARLTSNLTSNWSDSSQVRIAGHSILLFLLGLLQL